MDSWTIFSIFFQVLSYGKSCTMNSYNSPTGLSIPSYPYWSSLHTFLRPPEQLASRKSSLRYKSNTRLLCKRAVYRLNAIRNRTQVHTRQMHPIRARYKNVRTRRRYVRSTPPQSKRLRKPCPGSEPQMCGTSLPFPIMRLSSLQHHRLLPWTHPQAVATPSPTPWMTQPASVPLAITA